MLATGHWPVCAGGLERGLSHHVTGHTCAYPHTFYRSKLMVEPGLGGVRKKKYFKSYKGQEFIENHDRGVAVAVLIHV